MRLLLILLLTAFCCGAASAEWTEVPNPDFRTGLVIQPRFLNQRGKLILFWAGTSIKASGAELCLSTKEEDTDTWSTTRAPFFGEDLGRVRRLAVATGRDLMAVCFQRTPSQGGGAVEILLALSTDRGYSFQAPYVLDSYVADESSGTWLAVGARQGTRRDEFAASWIAEAGAVRVANVDLRSAGYRPEASTVGTSRESSNRVEIANAGSEGFYAIWAEGKGLKTCRIKPLTGGTEPAVMLATGDYQKNFCMAAGGYKGPTFAVAGDESGLVQGYLEEGNKFNPLEKLKITSRPRHLESRCSIDGDKKIHLALLSAEKSSIQITYTNNRAGQWTEPEIAMELDPAIPLTGFDICVVGDAVYLIAAQGQRVTIKKRAAK